MMSGTATLKRILSFYGFIFIMPGVLVDCKYGITRMFIRNLLYKSQLGVSGGEALVVSDWGLPEEPETRQKETKVNSSL